jgi:hypothetical protein
LFKLSSSASNEKLHYNLKKLQSMTGREKANANKKRKRADSDDDDGSEDFSMARESGLNGGLFGFNSFTLVCVSTPTHT